MNVTAMLGPAVGGALLAASGPSARPAAGGAGVLGAYAVLPLVSGATGQLWDAPSRPTAANRRGDLPLAAPRRGLRYSRTEAGLWTALVLAALVNFVAFPLQLGLLPVFAREVFHVGAAGLGLLGTALGVGAVLGSLPMAWGGAVHHAGQLMLWGTSAGSAPRLCVHPGLHDGPPCWS